MLQYKNPGPLRDNIIYYNIQHKYSINNRGMLEGNGDSLPRSEIDESRNGKKDPILLI